MDWAMKNDPTGLQTHWRQELADRYLAEGHWTNTTLFDLARAAVTDKPDHTFQIEGDRRMTRAEVWGQSLRLAGFFLSRGLKLGDVVSFQLPNWMETAVIALAARMCGLIINPIPPIYRESELSYILADCGAKLIFVPGTFRKHDHRAMLEGLRASLPNLQDIVVVRDASELGWDDVIGGEPVNESDLPHVDPSAILIAMYTSGTTGKPKGVLHTHYTYDHRIRAMAEAWKIGTDDVVFMPSPVTHITGAFWAFDMPWVAGNTSVLMDRVGRRRSHRLHPAQCLHRNVRRDALPATAGRHFPRPPEALSTLRLFFCGGTTVSPDLIRKASSTFHDCLFFRCYGSTEMTTATLGIRDRAQADLGADTDGEIVYPVEMNILDAVTNAPLPDGQEGEIIARGPGLFVGYLRPSDNKGNFLDDGFFRMGDLGRIVNDNYIVITGRKKDIIIRSGENISPKEVQGNRIWIFAVNAILNVSERWRYSDGDVRGIFFGSRGSARAEHAA